MLKFSIIDRVTYRGVELYVAVPGCLVVQEAEEAVLFHVYKGLLEAPCRLGR